MKKLAVLLLLLVFSLQSVSAQYNSEINQKIRDEGKNNSQIMKTLHVLADVYGPRMTGTPRLKAAGEWAAQQMKTWGFDNAMLEPWDFGNVGWVNDRASGFITSPTQDSLVFEVLAWTPSTKKTVKGQAFQIILPERPTQDELTKYFDSIKTQIKGKMVLMGKPAVIPVNINPQSKRLSDDLVRQRLNPNNPQTFPTPQPTPTPREGQLTNPQIGEQLDKFLVDSKVAVRINDAAREHGQIRAFNNRTFDIKKVVPTVVMRNEDFGRIARIMDDGTPVSLEFNIQNRIFPEGKTSYNTIGEITGTDKKDEVIMLGGHLDSWHSATGATDNAIGCAIMMEAARILKAIGVKPRRTIRVALWSGEEQGLLGSQAYVKQHFGSYETPLPFYEKFGGYFNIDSGTGKARGMSVFGPTEAADILREAVKPFEDLGILGAINTRSRGFGGSDHTSFNNAGLPGIGVFQDPIEYGSHTWHTNLDTYERIIEEDVKSAATVIAATVYVLAMRDEMLPRYPKDAMPKLPNN
ncbi:M28 family metallopeptidase [soil metagenome]